MPPQHFNPKPSYFLARMPGELALCPGEHLPTVRGLLAELSDGHIDEHLRGSGDRQLLLLQELLDVAVLTVEDQVALAAEWGGGGGPCDERHKVETKRPRLCNTRADLDFDASFL